MIPRSLLVLALVSQGACTIVGAGTALSSVASHNLATSDENDWHYTTPMLIGAGIGLIADITYLIVAHKMSGDDAGF